MVPLSAGQTFDPVLPVGRVLLAVGDVPLIGTIGVTDGDTDGRLVESVGLGSPPALLPPSNEPVKSGINSLLDDGKPVLRRELPEILDTSGGVDGVEGNPVLPKKTPVVLREDGGGVAEREKPVLATGNDALVGTNDGKVELNELEDGPGKPSLLPPPKVSVSLGSPPLDMGKPELMVRVGVTIGVKVELKPLDTEKPVPVVATGMPVDAKGV